MTSPDDLSPIRVEHDGAHERFVADVPGGTAVAEYEVEGDVVIFTHTEVPPESQGHGVADALVRVALDWARAEGLHVVPRCPFFALFIRRHPAYADLLAEGIDRS